MLCGVQVVLRAWQPACGHWEGQPPDPTWTIAFSGLGEAGGHRLPAPVCDELLSVSANPGIPAEGTMSTLSLGTRSKAAHLKEI